MFENSFWHLTSSSAGDDTSFGTSRLRLGTIDGLRWIAVAGQLIAVLVVHLWFGFELPILLCLIVIGLSAALNIVMSLRYPSSLRLRTPFALMMLTYDILQLALLLLLTGGLNNPFAVLLLVPVTISASTQSPRTTLFLGSIAVFCTTILLEFHYPLPWMGGEILDFPVIYRVGHWAAIVLGMVFLALYTWRIAKEGREMSQAVAATELVLAREQQLSALDGLAAAAAHELGTPLSTITVVARELQRELPSDSPWAEDIELLHSQVERCRNILATLTQRTGEGDDVYRRFLISHMLEEVTEPHRWPEVEIVIEKGPLPGTSEGGQREPILDRNSGILYALGNLVENAVDFAETKVVVSAEWDDHDVYVKIVDDGPGFSQQILGQLGEPFRTSRPSQVVEGEQEGSFGMGLGFFIANTFLSRSSAEMRWANRELPDHGAVVTISWARAKIDVGQ